MKYILQNAEKSFCSECHEPIDMLADYYMAQARPSFYICWPCKKVWQIGVGPIERDDPK